MSKKNDRPAKDAMRDVIRMTDPLGDFLAQMRRKREAGQHKTPPAEGPNPDACARAVSRLADQLGPKYSPERASLVTYQIYAKSQEPVFEQMEKLVADLPELIENSRNIVWYGSAGTGKDHMMASLLYMAAQLGFDAHYANVQGINEAVRDRMKKEKPERELIDYLWRPRVLGLSDPIPPAGEPSPWNKNLLYRVLDLRGRHLRPTWVTLNVSSKAAAEDEMKDALTVPVWDRMREQAELLPCFWPSFRGRRGP